MTDQLQRMRETVAQHKEKVSAMGVRIVELPAKRHGDVAQVLYCVEVDGSRVCQFCTRKMAQDFIDNIVRGEA